MNSFELWLNADITQGPDNANNPSVNGDKFLQLCQKYFNNKSQKVVLSPGFTTKLPKNEVKIKYDQKQMEEMAGKLKNVENFNFTFPMRAIFLCKFTNQNDLL